MDRKLWYLKQCDLFEELTREQASRLERQAAVRTFRRGAIIYFPTEPGHSVMLVTRGRVKLKDLTPDGKETIFAFIDEGELFGELALFDTEPRSEYAEAVIDSRVMLIPREDMVWLMRQRPDVVLSLTKLVGLRRRRIENRLRNVLFLPSRQRMVRLLLELVEAHGEEHGDRIVIRLPFTHQELASLIGVTRETVTVVVGQLQAERLIQVGRQRLVVLAWERLVEEANRSAEPRPQAKRGQRKDPRAALHSSDR